MLTAHLPEDKESGGFATLLEWPNIYCDHSRRKLFGAEKTRARIGCVQWQMREMASVSDLLQQVEYFIDPLSDYRCDVAIFPEFFNAPLMGIEKHQTSVDAIRFLSGYTEEIREAISKLAVSYNLNVVAGSMPLIEDEQLYNVSYLCKRDGSTEAAVQTASDAA